MNLNKIFKFDSAHKLINYKGKCENLHGHTYKLKVTVTGKVLDSGMIMDFNELSSIVNEAVISKLDHNYLNDVVSNPTAENISKWIFLKISEVLPEAITLKKVTLFENETSYVKCYKEDV
ncbi:MAG: 6-carboxytetrahydropterin synthase QueD [Pseudomonadota bacterium]